MKSETVWKVRFPSQGYMAADLDLKCFLKWNEFFKRLQTWRYQIHCQILWLLHSCFQTNVVCNMSLLDRTVPWRNTCDNRWCWRVSIDKWRGNCPYLLKGQHISRIRVAIPQYLNRMSCVWRIGRLLVTRLLNASSLPLSKQTVQEHTLHSPHYMFFFVHFVNKCQGWHIPFMLLPSEPGFLLMDESLSIQNNANSGDS